MAQLLQFPIPTDRGPFFIEEGSDGVDYTLDIISYRTGRVFGGTRYWEERDEAELQAIVFVAALNSYYGHAAPTESQSRLITTFKRRTPGPYRFAHEDGDMPAYVIRCEATGSCLYESYADLSDVEKRFSTEALLKALQQL